MQWNFQVEENNINVKFEITYFDCENIRTNNWKEVCLFNIWKTGWEIIHGHDETNNRNNFKFIIYEYILYILFARVYKIVKERLVNLCCTHEQIKLVNENLVVCEGLKYYEGTILTAICRGRNAISVMLYCNCCNIIIQCLRK